MVLTAVAQQQGVVARVNADNVYVRSGPSLNHYHITKLNTGDRVTVVSETPEWVEILPPEGTFSLISGEYVDTVNDETGVVNGSNVRVRAGSELTPHKYTVQLQLSKGAEVRILGRNPDGFLRIEPPNGATLWMSREYVDLAGGPAERDTLAPRDRTDTTTPVRKDTPDTTPAGTDPSAGMTHDEAGDTGPASDIAEPAARTGRDARKVSSPLDLVSTSTYRATLEQLDKAVAEEAAKPALERDFAPIKGGYAEIAAQESDPVARQYAEIRVQELGRFMRTLNVLRDLHASAEQTDAARRQLLDGRAQIMHFDVPTPSGIDAQGFLRVSALYPRSSGMNRYRLTDRDEKIVGYVEILGGTGIDVDRFLDRYVGVRASDQRLQPGTIRPVPIYVANELVLLDAGSSRATSNGQPAADAASPADDAEASGGPR